MREKGIEELIRLFFSPASRLNGSHRLWGCEQKRLAKLIFSQLNVGNVEFAVSLEEDGRRPDTSGGESRLCAARQTTRFAVCTVTK